MTPEERAAVDAVETEIRDRFPTTESVALGPVVMADPRELAIFVVRLLQPRAVLAAAKRGDVYGPSTGATFAQAAAKR